MNLHIIAGARPNFMKIAPIIRAIENAQKNGKDINYRLVHTGQHYDEKLSDTFFKQLNIPQPHVNLEVGSGTQAEQTAQIMVKYEKELLANPCNAVLVVGDVNSTMACAIVAKKLNTHVVHVEAGIRSGDITMPEEVNRIVTDSLTDWFFTTSSYANENLQKEGKTNDQVFYVGNTMIDSLIGNLPNLKKPACWDEFGLEDKGYFVLTMHRPANVDEQDKLETYMQAIAEGVKDKKVVFPVHPRTLRNIDKIRERFPNIKFIDPQGYLEFIYLVKHAFAVITDSGGVQEETTYLGVPCLTLRDNTERYETVSEGTNELIGTQIEPLKKSLEVLFSQGWKKGSVPKFWDGNTAERIIEILTKIYN
ncbi:MAG TPA: UDP-N-acetylglucosamine 2-epimerase (non-hydrolyzing) [Bacteroidia bacterium]|nr:UDP-N-acetylglucosamine 2-epimerase (non-hydrolyzing) [Bacteroidia bacterium]